MAPTPVALGKGILRFKNHCACEVNHSWSPCINESTAGYGTGNPDINLENWSRRC